MDLTHAKVLITGGSRGIGYATARLLLARGARVAIVARDPARLQQAAADLPGAVPLAGDVRREADVTQFVAAAIRAMGGLNVLVNNAGFGYIAPLAELQAVAFRRVWETNVLGAALCAREASRYFLAQRYGHIVNVGSTSATKANPGASPYVATKHALRGMTESWRGELRAHNIRVMLVNPSEVMTDFAAHRETPQGRQAITYTDAEQQTKLRAEEIATIIVDLLALDDRALVTEATVFATNPQR